jgi:hypothetical protein
MMKTKNEGIDMKKLYLTNRFYPDTMVVEFVGARPLSDEPEENLEGLLDDFGTRLTIAKVTPAHARRLVEEADKDGRLEIAVNQEANPLLHAAYVRDLGLDHDDLTSGLVALQCGDMLLYGKPSKNFLTVTWVLVEVL